MGDLGADEDDVWAPLPPDSAAGKLCEEVRTRLAVGKRPTFDAPEISIPDDFGQAYQGNLATQQIFGNGFIPGMEISAAEGDPPRGRDLEGPRRRHPRGLSEALQALNPEILQVCPTVSPGS